MRTLFSLFGVIALSACSAGNDVGDTGEDDLTSATARARKLSFSGYVYVGAGASDADILDAVRTQTQTAFGALRTSQVAVASRELKGVDASTFKKIPVKVGAN